MICLYTMWTELDYQVRLPFISSRDPRWTVKRGVKASSAVVMSSNQSSQHFLRDGIVAYPKESFLYTPELIKPKPYATSSVPAIINTPRGGRSSRTARAGVGMLLKALVVNTQPDAAGLSAYCAHQGTTLGEQYVNLIRGFILLKFIRIYFFPLMENCFNFQAIKQMEKSPQDVEIIITPTLFRPTERHLSLKNKNKKRRNVC